MSNQSSDKTVIRVMVVDDHPLIRQGIICVLNSQPDITVVGEASNGEMAFDLARELNPDLILMDIFMPGGDGIETSRRILSAMPEISIVILTVCDDDRYLFQAVEVGVQGYLLKDLEPTTLLEMVRGVFQGQAPISRLAAARLMNEYARRAKGKQPSLYDLSNRELEILQLVAHGDSNRQIAEILGIALYTVKNHVQSILEKLCMENRMQAAVFAARQGLLDANNPVSALEKRRLSL
jgi:DNA-binding NarL/FixJ family response regulator